MLRPKPLPNTSWGDGGRSTRASCPLSYKHVLICAWHQEIEFKPLPWSNRKRKEERIENTEFSSNSVLEQEGGELNPGLFLWNNTGEEGQADRTVISLLGAKAKTLPVSLGLEKLAVSPVWWAEPMISESRNLRRARPIELSESRDSLS